MNGISHLCVVLKQYERKCVMFQLKNLENFQVNLVV